MRRLLRRPSSAQLAAVDGLTTYVTAFAGP